MTPLPGELPPAIVVPGRRSTDPGTASAIRPATRPATGPGFDPTAPPPVAPAWTRIAQLALWILIVLPALYQISLLLAAIAGRIDYRYDLEWMEGGLLHHAERIRTGVGIYLPPSVDFIPYLYTPLYPALLAMLGKPFGVSYVLGRAVSVIGLAGIATTGIVSFIRARQHHLGVAAGAVLGLGLFAAYYPYVEGWYDLVRADTLFLFLITVGIAGLPVWARSDAGLVGHGKVAAGATLMALAFFCKQTGIFYVGFGGLLVLVAAPRRTPTYAAMAGLIGLGGCWLLNHASNGWFWVYVSEIHRAHDFNMDRFDRSFGNILWHFPAATIVIAATWLVVGVTALRTRSLPAQARLFALWSLAFALSIVVGAIGWGTEFAHFNAYIPAFLHGSFAAGAAVPAVIACVRILLRDHPRREQGATLAALAAAVPLAATCALARWEPARFIPSDADTAAGDRLVARLRTIDGDVWMPSHPWYLHYADKPPHVHRMGIKDVTTRQTRVIEGLDAKLRDRGFAAIVLDNHDVQSELPAVRQYYRPALELPANERPRVYTGASVVPESIWVPALPTMPPAGARVVFDFEAATCTGGWTCEGPAWGTGPVSESLPGQGLVQGTTGQRFATSMTGGDVATGRASSPDFALDGARLTLRLGGGDYSSDLRVELWVDDALAGTATPPSPPTENLRTVTIELGPELRGKHGKLVMIDDSTKGHLNVDDVWLWQ
ncbi:MAG TPA: hypothetical protein VH165_10890 [Kofleriaceae bacterium]|nr:hypothetical protein [Kofleriaceae bacterium]